VHEACCGNNGYATGRLGVGILAHGLRKSSLLEKERKQENKEKNKKEVKKRKNKIIK